METKNKIYLDGKEVTEELDRQLLQNAINLLMGLAKKIVGKAATFPHIMMKINTDAGEPLYVVTYLSLNHLKMKHD